MSYQTREQIEVKIQEFKPYLQETFGVNKIGIFGSYSRNEQTEESDIDILVSFSKPIGWEFIDLKDFLEEQLQRKVDLVTINALKPQIRDQILNEKMFLEDILQSIEKIEKYTRNLTIS